MKGFGALLSRNTWIHRYREVIPKGAREAIASSGQPAGIAKFPRKTILKAARTPVTSQQAIVALSNHRLPESKRLNP
jgi:hypothetical protein